MNAKWLLRMLSLLISMPVASMVPLQVAQIDNRPSAYIYVIKAKQRVAIKRASKPDWLEIQKFDILYPNDSLRIPTEAAVSFGEVGADWKELAGPRIIVGEARQKQFSRMAQFFKNLYQTFVIETRRRRVSIDAVRDLESLLLLMPDTVYAFSMPDTISWKKNAPWWMKYQVQITRNNQTVWDTVVQGNMVKLKPTTTTWQPPGNYTLRVILPQGVMLPREADSSVICLLNERQKSPMLLRFRKLKGRLEKNGQRDDSNIAKLELGELKRWARCQSCGVEGFVDGEEPAFLNASTCQACAQKAIII